MAGTGGMGGMAGVGGAGGAAPVCDPDPVAPGGNCPAECTACQGNKCLIQCDGQAECANKTITCPMNFDCQVVCSGQQGCQGSMLVCPSGYACDVSCGEVEACENLDISGGTASLVVTCLDHFQVCKGTQVTCGDGACGGLCAPNVAPKPTFVCGTSCDCTPCL